ncbi:RabGAP TBC [Dentipellis sp. KUC8613]|nr:RabGAP TBC [Dentipellis sp. KUC8613]
MRHSPGPEYRSPTPSSKRVSHDVDSSSMRPRHLSPTPPHTRPSSRHVSPPQNGHSLSPPIAASPRPVSSAISTPRTSSYVSPQLHKNASAISLSPSVGEDPDAFHVRRTYAELDVLGVKGDGYEEGVERTRARVGSSRESALQAANALADETEKKRELSQREVEMLASLDRYGFFNTPSHDRLTLLPATAFSKHLSRVSSVTTEPPNPTLLRALPPPSSPVHETSRLEKWGRMLEPRSRDPGGNIENWGIRQSKAHKLRERVYKGIPDRWRRAAWQTLLSDYSHSGKEEFSRLAEEYRQALEKPSPYDIQIDLDVPRTISGHILFRTRYGLGQRSLFHVLHSFSLRCSTCGYCQGMGPIAAMLLCYFEPERAYASLVQIHDAYQMHSIFGPGFPGLLESLYVQERIMEQMMPDVYTAFKNQMVSSTSYATKWYITLFANSMPFQTLLRLWDAFLLEGPDLFIVVAISVIWAYRDHITSSSANFETILSMLSSFFVPEDENGLLDWIGKVLADQKLRSNIRTWREEWKGLVASGKDSQALL